MGVSHVGDGAAAVRGEEEVGIRAWIAWSVLCSCTLVALALYHVGKKKNKTRPSSSSSSWQSAAERHGGKDAAAAAVVVQQQQQQSPSHSNKTPELGMAAEACSTAATANIMSSTGTPPVIAIVCTDKVTRRIEPAASTQSSLQPATFSSSAAAAPVLRAHFETFRRQYLLVWMLSAFTEFLKGPYTVPLYVEYGLTLQQIALIFITGALASLMLGTVAGALADYVGRAYMCRWFCLIHGMSMLSKLSRSFAVLMLGRVLDGLALSLQFTAFEAWMVTAHHVAGFDAAWLQETFAIVSCGSGAVAVVAGLWAEMAVYLWGNIGPFLSTLPLLAVALYHMRHWSENYGQHVLSSESTNSNNSTSGDDEAVSTEGDQAETASFVHASPSPANGNEAHRQRRAGRRPGSVLTRLRRGLRSAGHTTFCSLRAGWRSIRASPRLQLLGWCEILYESAFSVWCFCWAPLLGALTKHSSFGLIFASFMICMMIGGLTARLCSLRAGLTRGHEVAVASLAVAALLHRHKTAMYLAFLGFEVSSGMFSAVHPTLRSSWTLDDHRSAVLNLFRAPANVMAFVLLGIGLSLHHLLYIAVVLQVGSLLCMYRLRGDVR